MADKSFGIKELNLIGASGTPTITSPNNLNLNASNVAISTDLTVGRDLSIGSTLSVSGVSTLTRVNLGSINDFNDLISQGADVPLIKIGNDLVLATITDSDLSIYSNFIYSDEYDISIGTKGETGAQDNFTTVVGIHTGNDAFNPNTSYATLRYGNSETKLTTIGAGITVTGTTFTNQLNVSGVSTFTGTTYFGDGGTRILSSGDLMMNDLDSIVLSYSGSTPNGLVIRQNSSSNVSEIVNVGGDDIQIQADSGRSVFIGNDNDTDAVTINNNGVNVVGTTTTGQLSVSGVSTCAGSVRVGVSTAAGVILTSPNGTKYQLFVENDGTLKTVLVP